MGLAVPSIFYKLAGSMLGLTATPSAHQTLGVNSAGTAYALRTPGWLDTAQTWAALQTFGAGISVTGTVTGTTFSGSGASLTSIPESAVTNLVSDLALKSPLASPVFTGSVTLPAAITGVGGLTSSFPGFKRSTTTLAVRLADDTADAPITAGAATFSGTVKPSANATTALGASGSRWGDCFLTTLYVNTSSFQGAGIQIGTASSGSLGVLIAGSASQSVALYVASAGSSQTGNLFEGRNNSGQAIWVVNASGNPMLYGQSSTTNREMGSTVQSWVVSTDASRTARVVNNVYDTAAREAFRIEASGSAAMIGFLGASAVVRQTVSGSRGANAALASLLTALATLGLITDSSS